MCWRKIKTSLSAFLTSISRSSKLKESVEIVWNLTNRDGRKILHTEHKNARCYKNFVLYVGKPLGRLFMVTILHIRTQVCMLIGLNRIVKPSIFLRFRVSFSEKKKIANITVFGRFKSKIKVWFVECKINLKLQSCYSIFHASTCICKSDFYFTIEFVYLLRRFQPKFVQALFTTIH